MRKYKGNDQIKRRENKENRKERMRMGGKEKTKNDWEKSERKRNEQEWID